MAVVDLNHAPELREGDWLSLPYYLLDAAQQSGLSVITSYSIHYTKLYESDNPTNLTFLSFSRKPNLQISLYAWDKLNTTCLNF